LFKLFFLCYLVLDFFLFIPPRIIIDNNNLSNYELIIQIIYKLIKSMRETARAHLPASPSPDGFAMVRHCVLRAPSRFYSFMRADISIWIKSL